MGCFSKETVGSILGILGIYISLLKSNGVAYIRVGSTDRPVTRYELDEIYRVKKLSARWPTQLAIYEAKVHDSEADWWDQLEA